MVVEKYTKALLLSLKEEEIVPTYEALAKIASVAKNSKFILIIKSPLLSIDEKIKILSQIAEYDNPKFLNFLRIVLENKREDLLKEIYLKLYEKVSFYFNTFKGKVEGDIKEDILKEIEDKLSKKFNAKIKLSLDKNEMNGIKVFVEVLNIEIEINEEKIKSNLIDYILKAI
ncbi:MAG TPA: F0F1 ATP synthase subunit delta [Nautiliaceae bacterium]|nr:F0F1 ATP synthase subunit delta [Nautiliaceae bacterium]